MLTLGRKVGERIVIEGGIEILVTDITPTLVRLAIKADGLTVLRGELVADLAPLTTPPPKRNKPSRRKLHR